MNGIVIVDYGMGNLRSVANAFEVLGIPARISVDPGDLRHAGRIVLPGVGAFGEAMTRLSASGFVDALTEEVIGQGKPLLGICLGMQLLAERGVEHGAHAGLGWIPGEVRLIEPGAERLRVPHMGWNVLHTKRACRLLRALPVDPCFYFVHSYHLVSPDPEVVVGTCTYSGELAAAIEKANIFGTQFHPEKSHKAGLQVLKNFSEAPC